MKVVHINKEDAGGGASVAARRIHNALRKAGVDSSMLVANRHSDDPFIFSTSENVVEKISDNIHFLEERLAILPHERHASMRYNFSIANRGRDIASEPVVREADIIHLHWVNQGFLSAESLDALFALNKPIVWTLHDMWPFTGGCHYAGTCLEFNEHCYYCPFLRNPARNDLSARKFAVKKFLYESINMSIVSCSQWLNSLATNSALLRKKHCCAIPNPIDTTVYRPLDKTKCRQELGLPTDKKLLLFGAARVTDVRKGFRYLQEALRIVSDSYPMIAKMTDVIVFGRTKGKAEEIAPGFTVHRLEFISSTDTLVKLYNAADVFVLPSLQDNLPNTVVESLACGTPVVGFRIGGVPEMVEHRVTGYLAEVKNSLSLAIGINATLLTINTEAQRQEIARRARERYAEEIIAKQYIDVYQKALETEQVPIPSTDAEAKKYRPQLSIITITLNCADTLERTIASVARQERRYDKDIEYIVVDGGSTDGTMKIIDKYSLYVSKAISEKDDGLYYAMNKGLRLSRGKYIWFLNAGDELPSKTTVMRMLDMANDADVLYGDTVITDMDGKEIGNRRLTPPERLDWKSFKNGMLVCHQAFIAKRDICELYDEKSYRYSADFDWCIKILKKAHTRVNTHMTLVRFLDGGLTKRHIPEALRERFRIMCNHFGIVQTALNHVPIACRFLWFWMRKGRF